jgi:ferric-dicitrate binding protein FerR (iron transport regulator)
MASDYAAQEAQSRRRIGLAMIIGAAVLAMVTMVWFNHFSSTGTHLYQGVLMAIETRDMYTAEAMFVISLALGSWGTGLVVANRGRTASRELADADANEQAPKRRRTALVGVACLLAAVVVAVLAVRGTSQECLARQHQEFTKAIQGMRGVNLSTRIRVRGDGVARCPLGFRLADDLSCPVHGGGQ